MVLVSPPLDNNVMAIVFTSRVSRFRLTTKLDTEGAEKKQQYFQAFFLYTIDKKLSGVKARVEFWATKALLLITVFSFQGVIRNIPH